MRTSFLVAVLLVGLALAGGTAAGQPGTPLEGEGAAVAAVDGGNNSSASDGSVGFGSSVSSFIQSTAAETNTAVDQGIWEANVEGNATVEEARNRAARLGERVAELRAQRARLAKLRSNGTISLSTYVARDARLRAELRSLGAAANQTQQVAPNATAVQQSLAGVERAAEAVSGPPDEIANRTGAPLNIPGVGDGAENGSAPGEGPANASNGEGPANASNGEGPANASNGEGPANASNGEGPPSDVGNGQSNGAGNSSNGAGDGNGGSDTIGSETAGNGTAGSGPDGSGTPGANDSSSSSSNSASSSGTGSDPAGSSAGTAGDSSSGADGGAAGSATGSDGGTGDSDDSGTKTQSNAPGNPGPKSD